MPLNYNKTEVWDMRTDTADSLASTKKSKLSCDKGVIHCQGSEELPGRFPGFASGATISSWTENNMWAMMVFTLVNGP